MCTRSCDPIHQTGCPASSACGVYREADGAKRFFTDCYAPVGVGLQGGGCADELDCRAGYLCGDPDGALPGWGRQCMHYCSVLTGNGCPVGARCFAFSQPVLVSGIEYGLCL
jgi:hypothetical protein